MTYPYGMKNSPVVGNGLGGLPRRDIGGWMKIKKVYSSYGSSTIITFDEPADPGTYFVTIASCKATGTYGTAGFVKDFLVCDFNTKYFSPCPGGATNFPGVCIEPTSSGIYVTGTNGTDKIHSIAYTISNRIKSFQSVSVSRVSSVTDIKLNIQLMNPSKVFVSNSNPSYSTGGNQSFCANLRMFADAAAIPITAEDSGALYIGLIGFPDGNTLREYPTGTGGGATTLYIVEFE